MMTEKTRYFKIGFFALFSLALFCAGLILFGAGTVFEAHPILIETYYEESVQGLDIGAPVKFRGVKVGKVKDILFVKDIYGRKGPVDEMVRHFSQVCVRMELEAEHFQQMVGKSKAEIERIVDELVRKHTLRIKMNSIGITGLAYIEMGFEDPQNIPPLMKISWTPEYPYVPSVASAVNLLGNVMDRMMYKLDEDVFPMLDSLEEASKDLPEISESLKQILPRVDVISKNIEDITSTAKKYPSQMIFGEAPPKSRFDR